MDLDVRLGKDMIDPEILAEQARAIQEEIEAEARQDNSNPNPNSNWRRSKQKLGRLARRLDCTCLIGVTLSTKTNKQVGDLKKKCLSGITMSGIY